MNILKIIIISIIYTCLIVGLSLFIDRIYSLNAYSCNENTIESLYLIKDYMNSTDLEKLTNDSFLSQYDCDNIYDRTYKNIP